MRIESVQKDASGNAKIAFSGGILFFVERDSPELASIGCIDAASLCSRLESLFRSGEELSADIPEIDAIVRADQRYRASLKALELCSRAEQHSRGLFAKLQDRGFSKAAIEAAIKKTQEEGALDDARYVEVWARSRAVKKLLGPRALANELKAKGLGRSAIEQGLALINFDAVLLDAFEKLAVMGLGAREADSNLRARGFESWRIEKVRDGLGSTDLEDKCNT